MNRALLLALAALAAPLSIFAQDFSGEWEGSFTTSQNLNLVYKVQLVKKAGQTYAGIALSRFKGLMTLQTKNSYCSAYVELQPVEKGGFILKEIRKVDEKAMKGMSWGLKHSVFQLSGETGKEQLVGEYYCVTGRRDNGNIRIRRASNTVDAATTERILAMSARKVSFGNFKYYPRPLRPNNFVEARSFLSIVFKNEESSDIGFYLRVTSPTRDAEVRVNPGVSEGNCIYMDMTAGRTREDESAIEIRNNLFADSITFHIALTDTRAESPSQGFASATYTVPAAPFFRTKDVVFNPSWPQRAVVVDMVYKNPGKPEMAKATLEKLIAAKDKLAEGWKAHFLHYGFGGYQPHANQAFELARRNYAEICSMARNGDREAVFLTASFHNMGIGNLHEQAFGKYLWRYLSGQGFGPAAYHLALEELNAQQYSAAYELLLKAWEQDVAKAASVIGFIRENGLMLNMKDKEKGLEWYKKGMEKGDDAAFLQYARFNYESNIAEALGVMEKRAEAGSSPSMVWLGNAYALHPQKKNIAQAEKWLNKAAAMGDREAMFLLGYWRDAKSQMEGWPQNTKESFAWLEKAALAGQADAMMQLALLYSEGNNQVMRDEVKANYWSALSRASKGSIYKKLKGDIDYDLIRQLTTPITITTYYAQDGTVIDESSDLVDPFRIIGAFGKRWADAQKPSDKVWPEGCELISEQRGKKTYAGVTTNGFTSSIPVKKGQIISIRVWSNYYRNKDSNIPDGPIDMFEWQNENDMPRGVFTYKIGEGNWKIGGSECYVQADADGWLSFKPNFVAKNQSQQVFQVEVYN